MKRKTWVIIFVVICVVVAILLLVVFWDKIFPPKDEKEQQKEEEQQYQEQVQEAIDNNQPIPPKPTLPDGSFPLSVKDKNAKVKSMQEALIKMGCTISAGATGYFGAQTQGALKCAGYNDSKIEQSDYDNIILGNKNIVHGSRPVATISGGKIYSDINMTKEVGTTIKGSSHGFVAKNWGNLLGLTTTEGSYSPQFYVKKEYFV